MVELTSVIGFIRWLLLAPRISVILLPTVTALVVLSRISADLFILVIESSALSMTTPSFTRLNWAPKRSLSASTPCKFSTLKSTELIRLLTSHNRR